jgi:uncharacterized repeat protein (TIGR03803 family)
MSPSISLFNAKVNCVKWLVLAVLAAAAMCFPGESDGQTYKMIFSFSFYAESDGLLRLGSEGFIGSVHYGGQYTYGNLYQIDAAGNYTDLYDFTGGADGAFPLAALLGDKLGNVYGITLSGPHFDCTPQSCGAVYRFNVKTRSLTVLHTFNGLDGYYPQDGLVRGASGTLYGGTGGGGTFDCGTVFKIDPAGTFTTLHSFNCTEGAVPQGSFVLDSKEQIYGVLRALGKFGYGGLFQLNQSGEFTSLYDFNLTSGGDAVSGLVADHAGNLYGVAGGGAYGAGVVYRLNLNTGSETVLYNFTGTTDGANPYAQIARDHNGNLYGTTTLAGDPVCQCGTVFRVDASGTFTTLHTFTGPDGMYPFYGALIVDKSGTLYGTATGRGDYGDGVLFSIAPY